MFGYRDCVVEPASGAEAGAEPAEMQIEGGGEAAGAGAYLEGACAEEAAGAEAQSPQLAANLASFAAGLPNLACVPCKGS